jgi:hypothetical protein
MSENEGIKRLRECTIVEINGEEEANGQWLRAAAHMRDRESETITGQRYGLRLDR